MEPILVGIDGSRSSEQALRWACGAATDLGAELMLATAVAREADASATATLLLERWSAPAQRAGCPFRGDVVVGAPGPALASVAASIEPSLVVVGAGHERWYPALHLGSASHFLAQHSPIPVCIVPLHKADFSPTQIVVGLDGSPGSRAAAGWAARLAAACHGKATAVFAWQHSASRMHNVAVGIDDQHAGQQACREWAAPLEEAGVLSDVVVAEGDPCAVLARAVAETGAGMLVLGGRAERGRLGIAPLCVLQAAVAPTVLVR